MADNNSLYTRQRAFQYFNNYLNILPDPDLILRERNQEIQVYRELTFDSHVESCITSRESGVLSNEWIISPGSSSRNDKKAADFCNELFTKLDIQRIMREAQESVFFGFSVLEKIKIKDGSNIIYQDIVGKPQEWFKFDQNNNLVFITKDKISQGEPVDMKTVELVRYKASYRNPYGERKLARIFWPVVFKRGGLKFWTEFAERFGGVMLVGTVPQGTKDDKKQATLSMLKEMVNSAVAVIENGDVITPMSPAKDGSNVFANLITMANGEISKAILGQTLTTENASGTGSFAMSQTHQEVRRDIIESDKKLVKQVMDNLIRDIVSLNFNVNKMPEFKFYEEEEIKLDRAQRDNQLKALGVNFSKDYFMTNYNLDDTEFELNPVQDQGLGGLVPQFSEQGKKKIQFLK